MVRVEVTGSASTPTKNVQCVRVGGTLTTMYKVHNGNATVRWSPVHVFRDGISLSPSITALGPPTQEHALGRAVKYNDGGKVKMKEIIRDLDSRPWYPPSHDRLASGD